MGIGDQAQRARVLWLTQGLGRGGAERLLVGLARTIDRERFDIEVAYVLPWKDALAGELADAGIVTHCLGGAHVVGPSWAPRFVRLVRDRRYDLVHTHAPGVGAVARLTLGRRVALVHTEHNAWERHRRVARALNALTFNRNDAVIAVSEGVASTFRPIKVGRAPEVDVILHGPDLSAVRAGPAARARARDRLGVANDVPVVGTVGTLSPKKDQSTLLDAFALLAVRVPDARLALIGDGVLRDELEAKARSLGLAERVAFLGLRDDVQELLPAFDVFVLSSRHEGLPISLLEAMAAHVACVATAVGGVPEVIADGDNGLLVPPGDARALVEAIGALLDDDDRRERLAEGGARTSTRFSLTDAVRRTERVYEEVLARRRAT